jgi:hypothetical protein
MHLPNLKLLRTIQETLPTYTHVDVQRICKATHLRNGRFNDNYDGKFLGELAMTSLNMEQEAEGVARSEEMEEYTTLFRLAV